MKKASLPDRPAAARLRRVERLGYVLDNAIRIPLLNYRIGWDALIGLVPGAGDVAGVLLSAYIIIEAARLGVPKGVLVRMLGNVGVEAIVGAVPLLGDLFDAAWKANARNVAMLHAHLGLEKTVPRRSSKGSVLTVTAVVVGVVVMLAALVAGLAWGLQRLLSG